MNVLILSPGADTGGQGYRIKRAFDEFGGEFKVRSVHRTNNYIKFPYDLMWDDKIMKSLYEWADVVHHKVHLAAFEWLDNGAYKPSIIHHHGSRLRDNLRKVKVEDRSVGAIPLVSTVDLLHMYDGATWLPAPVDVEWIAQYRKPQTGRPIRICQAPTNRKIKSTDLVLATANELSKKYELMFDLVEMTEWKVALSRKGRCDIFMDQLILGYGNNALEAWAMKLPVIAGVADPEIRERMIRMWGELPFYEATEENLYEKMEDMIKSPELREEYGLRGYNHVLKYHSEQVVVDLLKTLWASAPPTKGRLKLAPIK